jgi:hypothetical protein
MSCRNPSRWVITKVLIGLIEQQLEAVLLSSSKDNLKIIKQPTPST